MEYILIFISAIFVNNIVLSQFLGICPFLGVSKKIDTKAYAMAEEYMNRFIKKNGSVVCRELLGYDLSKPEEKAVILEKNLFRTVCPDMIRSAVEALDEIIEEQKQ